MQYKATEFNYVGRMTAVLETMISWHGAKAQNIQDVRKYETVAGGTGPTSPTEGYPRLLNAFAGTKFKIVSGYTGTSDIMLAMERGEVDALENSWNTVIRTKQDWVDTKKINVLIQAALERSKELPDVPTLVELGNTPQDQAALAFYVSSAAVSRSMIATPGIPPERVKALRDAFNATGKDPEFLAEIEKTHSEFTPASGEYLQELARKVAATPPEVIRTHRRGVASQVAMSSRPFIEREPPGAMRRDHQQRADDRNILQRLDLIGRPRRTFHGPEWMREENREHRERTQCERRPARFESNQNHDATDQINACHGVGNHRWRQHVAGCRHEFQHRRARYIG